MTVAGLPKGILGIIIKLGGVELPSRNILGPALGLEWNLDGSSQKKINIMSSDKHKVSNDQNNIIFWISTTVSPKPFPHAPPGSFGPTASTVLPTELAGGLRTLDSIRWDGEMGLSGSFIWLGWPVYGAWVSIVAHLCTWDVSILLGLS